MINMDFLFHVERRNWFVESKNLVTTISMFTDQRCQRPSTNTSRKWCRSRNSTREDRLPIMLVREIIENILNKKIWSLKVCALYIYIRRCNRYNYQVYLNMVLVLDESGNKIPFSSSSQNQEYVPSASTSTPNVRQPTLLPKTSTRVSSLISFFNQKQERSTERPHGGSLLDIQATTQQHVIQPNVKAKPNVSHETFTKAHTSDPKMSKLAFKGKLMIFKHLFKLKFRF